MSHSLQERFKSFASHESDLVEQVRSFHEKVGILDGELQQKSDSIGLLSREHEDWRLKEEGYLQQIEELNRICVLLDQQLSEETARSLSLLNQTSLLDSEPPLITQTTPYEGIIHGELATPTPLDVSARLLELEATNSRLTDDLRQEKESS